jgi:hypothetical protein
LAPIGADSAVAPAVVRTVNVAPVSATLDIRYARFDVAAGYPTWFTRTNAVPVGAGAAEAGAEDTPTATAATATATTAGTAARLRQGTGRRTSLDAVAAFRGEPMAVAFFRVAGKESKAA